jgi:hypothetical protein
MEGEVPLVFFNMDGHLKINTEALDRLKTGAWVIKNVLHWK